MKPIIKYSGGKFKEIKNFRHFIPNSYKTYIEPFFGGGAVFFDLEPEQAIINDLNVGLYKFYYEIINNYETVRNELDEIEELYKKNQLIFEKKLAQSQNNEKIENNNEKLFYEMRDAFNNKFQSHYSYATIYYFINKTAYSGIVRYNSKGEYNVPFGRYKNLNTSPIDKSHIELLKSAKLYNKDYSEIFNMAGKDDFMFLDPPYDCVFSDYGNQKYKNGFPEEEHKRLANDFRNLPCKALMIIGKTPLIEDLYRPYIKEEYAKSYAINIKNRFSTDTTHLIVANYESKEGGLLI